MKHRGLILFFTGFLLLISGFVVRAESRAGVETRPKLVVLLVNYVNWDDLYQARAPFLQSLIRDGAVGVLNTKTLSKYNPSGSYLTIGISCRAKILENIAAFDTGEKVSGASGLTAAQHFQPNKTELTQTGIIVPEVAHLRTLTHDVEPNANPGMLGQILKENGKRIALFGNADIPSQIHREAALMVMDTSGSIPLGTVSNEVLEADPAVSFSYRTNYETLLQKIKGISGSADLIVVETGDTSRLEYDMIAPDPSVPAARRKLIEGMDPFLARLMAEVQPENLLLFGATPNQEMVQQGNTGLTPILLYGQGRGFLTSPSTRRSGFVTNLDLAATICNLTGIGARAQNKIGKGYPVQVIDRAQTTSPSPVGALIREETFFQNLRRVRYPMNTGIIALYLIGLLTGFIFIKRGCLGPMVLKYLIGVIGLLLLPLAILAGGITGYSLIWLPVALILVVTFSSALVLVKFLTFRQAMALILILVPVVLLIDVFSGGQWMLRSVMGSDLIAGGRFYGIGNDLMGVIVGSLTAGIGLVMQECPLLRRTAGWWGPLVLLVAAIGIGVPSFGANVGGMITALMTGMATFMVIGGNRVSWRKLTLGFLGIIMIVVLVACGDAFLNPSPTHAGRAILTLIDQGSAGFFQIIKVKLSILGGAIISSWWSLLFWIELLAWPIVKRHLPDFLPLLKREYPFWWMMTKSLWIGCFTALLLNDTGIIPAALILAYFWLISAGLYLSHALEENRPLPMVKG